MPYFSGREDTRFIDVSQSSRWRGHERFGAKMSLRLVGSCGLEIIQLLVHEARLDCRSMRASGEQIGMPSEELK